MEKLFNKLHGLISRKHMKTSSERCFVFFLKKCFYVCCWLSPFVSDYFRYHSLSRFLVRFLYSIFLDPTLSFLVLLSFLLLFIFIKILWVTFSLRLSIFPKLVLRSFFLDTIQSFSTNDFFFVTILFKNHALVFVLIYIFFLFRNFCFQWNSSYFGFLSVFLLTKYLFYCLSTCAISFILFCCS